MGSCFPSCSSKGPISRAPSLRCRRSDERWSRGRCPMSAMPPEFARTFRDSMPPSYSQHLTHQDIAEHAEIAWRRGDELAHAEIWTKRPNAIVVCVVADDRPGLSTLIRATVVA